jgi:hypothetical protein
MTSFESHPLSQILPLSRLALMATASWSPLFAVLAEATRDPVASEAEKDMLAIFKRTLLSSLQHSLLSTDSIPELFAESTLSGNPIPCLMHSLHSHLLF